jgi:ribosomal protein S3
MFKIFKKRKKTKPLKTITDIPNLIYAFIDSTHLDKSLIHSITTKEYTDYIEILIESKHPEILIGNKGGNSKSLSKFISVKLDKTVKINIKYAK